MQVKFGPVVNIFDLVLQKPFCPFPKHLELCALFEPLVSTKKIGVGCFF